MEIIRAGIEHSGVIATMFAKLHAVHAKIDASLFREIENVDSVRDGIKKSIEEKTRIFFIAVKDGEACGYLEGSLALTEDSELFISRKISRIENLYVLPEKRRMGCARALFNAFLDYAESRGIFRMELDAMGANDDAIAFYRSVGFEPYKITYTRGK